MIGGGTIAGSETVVLACRAMGTRFEFVLCGPDPSRLTAAGEAAIDEVLCAHDRLTRFERSSVVSSINESAGRSWVRVDSEVFGLLELCERVRAASGAAFDPALGGGRVLLDQTRSAAMLDRPGASIDLGAIGKGFGLDLARETLLDAGVTHGLIHGGTSSAAAVGPRPDGGAWVITVPTPDGGGALRVALRDGALGVSASEAGDTEGSRHVVDPRSGVPVASASVAAVVRSSAAEADAWATAAVVDPSLRMPRAAVWSDGRWVCSGDWPGEGSG